MNKLQALLIAGLLSLTSVSFASGVLYNTGGFTGVVTLDSNDPITFGIAYDSDVSKVQYYKITNNGPEETYFSIGNSVLSDKNGSVTTDTVALSLYSDASFDEAFLLAGDGIVNSLWYVLTVGTEYFLKAEEAVGISGSSSSISISAVPVPAAGILFASALFGAGAFGRRKKKAKASVVGAFARVS